MPPGNQNSGPNKRLNGPDGRARNTQTSNASRTGGVPQLPGFGASFGSVGEAAGSLAGAWASLQNQLALSEQQRKGYRAAFKTERANIRASKIGEMSDAINTGIEAGMTGSSNVSQARIGVLASRRQEIEAAKTSMLEQSLASRQADEAQKQQMLITQAQVDLQAEAARQQAALTRQSIAAQQAASADMAAALASLDQPGHEPGTSVFQFSTKRFGEFTGTKGQFKNWLNEQRNIYKTRQNFIAGRVASGRM